MTRNAGAEVTVGSTHARLGALDQRNQISILVLISEGKRGRYHLQIFSLGSELTETDKVYFKIVSVGQKVVLLFKLSVHCSPIFLHGVRLQCHVSSCSVH